MVEVAALHKMCVESSGLISHESHPAVFPAVMFAVTPGQVYVSLPHKAHTSATFYFALYMWYQT